MRKEPSGAEKRRKRKKLEEFLKSRENAMLKYLKKPENSSISEPIGTRRTDNEVEFEKKLVEPKIVTQTEPKIVNQTEPKKEEHFSGNISDSVNWLSVDSKLRYELVKTGPTKRDPTGYEFRKNASGRRFSHALYTRHMENREKVDRNWLVYSKALDKAFCFCCKLFRHEIDNGGDNLVKTGYNGWGNVSTRLKEHETRPEHIMCMVRWRTLELGERDQTIDQMFKENIKSLKKRLIKYE